MVLEGADLVLPTMGVPDWTFNVLVAVVVLTLPIVVTLSWVFDLTPGGLVKTGSSQESTASHEGKRLWSEDELREAGWTLRHKRPEYDTLKRLRAPTASARSRRDTLPEAIDSLAILPFVNSGGDPEGDYISDGITESIINKMSRISGVRVVPRASAFRYRESVQTLEQVGEELSVRAIVTGSVKHHGARLLVQAELVDVEREAQLWGEHYSGAWSDVFEVQEEIASEISKSLKLELTGDDQKELEKRETEHPEAYQEYLRGRFHWNKRTAEGFRTATTHFRAAIGRDPQYAEAYTGLADTYNVLGYYTLQAPGDSYPPAKVAAEKALEIDPELAEAHASLGYATLFYDRDWEQAREHFERSIALNPKYASAHQWYGWYLLVMERFEETVAAMERALSLDPLSLIINDHLAYAYMLADRFKDARRQIDRTRGLDPDYPLALWRLGEWYLVKNDLAEAEEAYARAAELTEGRLAMGYLGLTYGLSGQEDEARGVLRRLDELAANGYVSPLDRALVHAGLGEADEAFRRLEEAAEERVSDIVRLRLLPWPEWLKADPRFIDLAKSLRLGA
jgi:TolB-like protein/Tfp pilus assembly protein PilF